jgi:hypothetical protein
MTDNHSDQRKNAGDEKGAADAGDTRSGNPNSEDPNRHRSTEHKSGYGGDGGSPRNSSDSGQKVDK